MPVITLRDIAEKAGVSTATVSRVLRKQGPTSDLTAARILQIAQELNYSRPRATAVASKLQHGTIGMAIAGVGNGVQQDSFFAEVVAGASAEADRRELSLSVATLPADPSIELGLLRRGRIDGLIVGGVPIADEYIAALRESPVPLVWIGRYHSAESLTYVAPDNVGGGRLAAQHLVELGHRHIVVLSGPSSVNAFKDRLHGAQDMLGTYESVVFLPQPHFDESTGYQATAALLDEGERPTAILALSDWMAIGALRALRERGLRVPQDVSLVGYSNLPAVDLLDPPLTTIHVPQRQLGALAVHLLHARLTGEIAIPVGMIVPVELKIRESTAPPRINAHA